MRVKLHKAVCKAIGFALSLAAAATQALPIYQSDEVILEMNGWVSLEQINTDGETFLDDGPSRYSFDLTVPDLYGGWTAGVAMEWGLRLTSARQDIIVSGNQQASPGETINSLFLRRGNLFASHDTWGEFRAGKQWSVYYDVTSKTDDFRVGGGFGSGTYNFGTDGGPSGTGRADGAISWRKKFPIGANHLQVGLQYAAHTADIDIEVENVVEVEGIDRTLLICPAGECEFDNIYGASLTYTLDWYDNLFFGVAYNHAELVVETRRGKLFDATDLAEPILIDDRFSFDASRNDEAFAIGIAYGPSAYQPGFYGAVVWNKSRNHELAPPGSTEEVVNLFDAVGSESLFSWGWDDCHSVYFGHNILESDDDEFEQALVADDEFRLAQYYLGLNYRWNQRVNLFLENRWDNSNEVAQPISDDFLAVGIRIDI
ncbi:MULTISPECIES: porin [unclassified Microbulbifer]|uniref:porin n=1 Tax=unclassified Microbulbifer TaxID=2619833 RepID=UPI0027E3EAA6|nr:MULTISPECIES: porin [unclassified Microbulbifer]